MTDQLRNSLSEVLVFCRCAVVVVNLADVVETLRAPIVLD